MTAWAMSTFPNPVPGEEKKPGFLRRPVPMWAFLILVIVFIFLLVLPLFVSSPLPTIQQPLVVTNNPQTIYFDKSNETITANFTIANLNATNSIPATVVAAIINPVTHATLTNTNITLTILGVQTGANFVSSSGNNVDFPPGASTIVVRAVATNAVIGNYTLRLSFALRVTF